MKKLVILLCLCELLILTASCADEGLTFTHRADIQKQVEMDTTAMSPIPCEHCHLEAREQRDNFIHANFDL